MFTLNRYCETVMKVNSIKQFQCVQTSLIAGIEIAPKT